MFFEIPNQKSLYLVREGVSLINNIPLLDSSPPMGSLLKYSYRLIIINANWIKILAENY